ncbi:ZP domain-containing protein-like [Lytechinus variegatus]|uniref:ZP domain-containing protein-like n=1 Tax=Lytechinus variegatus TaxID=7654 RepID=UPI001BB18FF3|nr:ZP domain-containing protein-like [Lytechinus variegatus]
MALRMDFLFLAFLTITGINAQVLPELDNEGIILTCTDTQMIVEIPRSVLTGASAGQNVRFQYERNPGNSYCLGVDTYNVANERIIKLTTNLTACGTRRTESRDKQTYTNRVVSRHPGTDVISRQHAIEIPVSCSYNRNKRVGGISYQLTDYTIDTSLHEEGAYTFFFDIYTDSSYGAVVDTYPIIIGLDEELYFAASVLSLDDTLDLSIRSCRATPTADYNSPVKYDFIGNACSLDGDDTNINQLTDSRIGVQINTFRFIDQGNTVYIHCDLLVCDARDTASLCKKGCITRRRRDEVSSGLKTKRFTRGPIRVRHAAQSQESSSNSRMDIRQSEASAQQEVINAFKPRIVVAMATVVMLTAILVVVVLRKVSNISAAPKRSHHKEESARFIDEIDEI